MEGRRGGNGGAAVPTGPLGTPRGEAGVAFGGWKRPAIYIVESIGSERKQRMTVSGGR